jgi:hypothetical protein
MKSTATNEYLRAVLDSALKSRSALPSGGIDSSRPFWPAQHFKLDRVTVFRDSSEEERQEILNLCGASLLAESYFIGSVKR